MSDAVPTGIRVVDGGSTHAGSNSPCVAGHAAVTAKCLTTSQERQDYDTQDFIAGNGIRRLTPVECERLQGFPDGWTIPDDTPWQEHPKPDGPRYAQMGNAVTVPVIEWIGRRLVEYGA